MNSPLQETASRICTRCLEQKPHSEFHRHPKGRDGLNSHCKPCVKRPTPTLTCRLCDVQWTARTAGRPAKLCDYCRISHKVCYRCDVVKPLAQFGKAQNHGQACKQCMSAPRTVECRNCGLGWKLLGAGVPPKLCPACEASLKFCQKCEQAKPHSAFNASSKTRTGLMDHCRECVQKWYEARGARLRRNRDLMLKYNSTHEEWDRILNDQNHRCACCKGDLGIKPALDHCHQTMAIRGILCSNCNTGIGKLGDTPEGLDRAQTYLWSNRNVLSELASGLHNLSEMRVG